MVQLRGQFEGLLQPQATEPKLQLWLSSALAPFYKNATAAELAQDGDFFERSA
jgi:hypothetical protein